MIRETKLFYQDCLREVVSSDSLDWRAFHEFRNLSKKWELQSLRGFGVRSRAQDFSLEEEATVFHVRKARQNYRNSKIESLKDPKGDVLTSRNGIEKEIVRHFTSIFKERPLPDSTFDSIFFDGLRDRCPDAPFLTAPISALDITNALQKTKMNKSPGTDGLPFEFYVVFWDVIAPHFLDMFNHVLERESLSPSQGRAAVRLIPKSNGVCGMSGYRPISLLNTDYKLMASVLADRLKRTLKDTVSPSQKGGVPGRLLSDNLCLYRDVIHYVGDRSKPERHPRSRNGFGASIIGVDFEKAYDLVNRELLWRIMSVIGYPERFIQWLKTLYSVADMTLLNGADIAGHVTEVQSVRQGCPLSVHLFIIYIEPLLTRLESVLGGIQLPNQSVRVRAYVDDVAIFVSSDGDIVKAGEALDLYCLWTKMMINKQKTKALGLGAWSERQVWPLTWLHRVPFLKLLGIEFSLSIAETQTRLWSQAHGLFYAAVKENISRQMPLFHRVCFLKSHVLSKMIYIAQLFPCPKSLSEKLLSYCVSFTWSKFLEKPQRSPCYRHPTQGGISLPNPRLFFQSLFLKPIYNTLIGPESPERSLLRYWMSLPLRQHLPDIFERNFPFAVIERPAYIEEPVRHIKNLIDSGTITPGERLVHRQIYNYWISEITSPGKTEILYPHLDWDSIWKRTAALPPTIKQTMFLFNQRLLPTKARCHRLDQMTNNTCALCQLAPETDEHLMIQCTTRRNIITWLERTIHRQGCRTPPMEFIRGHLGTVNHQRRSFALVAAYVHLTWEKRKDNRIPTPTEIESLWAFILSQKNTPST